ncbi:MAG: amidohydrolase [Phycisphaerae bacterium]|nr:amidohydrolase [Phycisphaerae bacterium]
MSKINRRSFLGSVGGALAASGLARRAVAAAASDSADLVLRGVVVLTMDDARPVAQAMAVKGGRIQAVGSDQEIGKLVGDRTKVVDLDGKCVTPGLIDAHSHVIGFGQMQLKYVLLRPPKVNSFETLGRELAKAAREVPRGEWIVGRGFDEFKEGRFPRRWELDKAVPDHPTLIIHWGGQFGVANTLALKKADLLSADAKDPYGGEYLRDRRTGVPDGVLIHYPAIYSVYQPELDEREQIECAEWGMKQFAAQGVTCIHDNFCHPKYARAYVALEKRGQLPCRVRVYPYVPNLRMCQVLTERVMRYDGPLVRLQGVKLAVDGYALMHNPPPNSPQMELPMHPRDQFNEIIATIHRAGFQADVHAVGDKGVDWTLDAYAKAAGSQAECRRRRHRIEHFPFRKMDSIRRAADMGVPVCIQPNYIEVKAADFARKLGRSSKSLVETMVPLRSFSKEGVHVAYGADVPAFPSHRPMDSIRSAMDRKTGDNRRLDSSEAVAFLDALRHHTIGSAYAAFDDKDLGSLAQGKLADFVIWETDLRQIKTGRQAAALEPRATYLAGKVVYQAT